jgi:hypothetical protein
MTSRRKQKDGRRPELVPFGLWQFERHGYEARFTMYGNRAHIVPSDASAKSLCGVWAPHGTATQAEWGRAHTLPLCTACEHEGLLWYPPLRQTMVRDPGVRAVQPSGLRESPLADA